MSKQADESSVQGPGNIAEGLEHVAERRVSDALIKVLHVEKRALFKRLKSRTRGEENLKKPLRGSSSKV
jgi:hypothetical protein